MNRSSRPVIFMKSNAAFGLVFLKWSNSSGELPRRGNLFLTLS